MILKEPRPLGSLSLQLRSAIRRPSLNDDNARKFLRIEYSSITNMTELIVRGVFLQHYTKKEPLISVNLAMTKRLSSKKVWNDELTDDPTNETKDDERCVLNFSKYIGTLHLTYIIVHYIGFHKPVTVQWNREGYN